ncbi:MAG: hypothetical protein Q9226_003954 [Calogaya cf. arnoldii]
MDIAILRSLDLTTATERNPIPTSGVFPEDLISPFPNWTPQRVHSYLKLHARNTLVHDELSIIFDTRSLEGYTRQVAENTPVFADTVRTRTVRHEVQTLRATFRDSVTTLVNLDVANTDMEEAQLNAEGDGGVSMTGETEESRKRDLEDATLGETVLRDGKILRD